MQRFIRRRWVKWPIGIFSVSYIRAGIKPHQMGDNGELICSQDIDSVSLLIGGINLNQMIGNDELQCRQDTGRSIK